MVPRSERVGEGYSDAQREVPSRSEQGADVPRAFIPGCSDSTEERLTMKMMLAGISALLLTAVCLPSIDPRLANPEPIGAPRPAPGGGIFFGRGGGRIP